VYEPIDRKISWEVGILLYKMLFGKYPFKRNGRKIREVFEDIVTKDLDFKESPIIISESCKAVLKSLLNKDQLARLSIITNLMFHTWSNDK